MDVNSWLRAIAGLFVVLSVIGAVTVNLWFLAFTAFVGLNLFQSAQSQDGNQAAMDILIMKELMDLGDEKKQRDTTGSESSTDEENPKAREIGSDSSPQSRKCKSFAVRGSRS